MEKEIVDSGNKYSKYLKEFEVWGRSRFYLTFFKLKQEEKSILRYFVCFLENRWYILSNPLLANSLEKIMYFTYFITHFILIINTPAYLGNKTYIFLLNIWTGFISIYGSQQRAIIWFLWQNILFILQQPDSEPKSSL